ncbi:hypothetical protein KIPB_002751 [Kipferlia bialata]|uniref:Uncharacterized protein n=1 Tax=Kipferlia bialata TaxID=797122 RepID=A0A391NPU6_9EUKA|nr:hypothetical protein KIPB_002751 [Kipferlia bialata]|eukprot:g2751.t1
MLDSDMKAVCHVSQESVFVHPQRHRNTQERVCCSLYKFTVTTSRIEKAPVKGIPSCLSCEYKDTLSVFTHVNTAKFGRTTLSCQCGKPRVCF